MTSHRYTLSPQQRELFQQMYILTRMEVGETYPVNLPGALGVLEPLLGVMMSRRLVKLDQTRYVLEDLGKECLSKFRKRYTDYLQMYDVFSAVDLGQGIFAFAEILTMSPQAFKMYMQHSAWEDLRVAVAVYKGLDPVEIVFMSFLNEGRFDTKTSPTGWTIDLLGGMLWDEILKICSSNLHTEDLGGDDVIEDIINQGTQLMVSILNTSAQTQVATLTTQESMPTVTTETVTVVEEVVTYERVGGLSYSYGYPYDYAYLTTPLYVAPIWYEPYYFWY